MGMGAPQGAAHPTWRGHSVWQPLLQLILSKEYFSQKHLIYLNNSARETGRKFLLQFIRVDFGPSLPFFGKTWQWLSPRNQGTAQSYKPLCVGKQKGHPDAHSTFQHSLLFAAWPSVGIQTSHLRVLAGDPSVTGATSSRYRTFVILYFCFMFSNQDQLSNWFLYEDTNILLWGVHSFSLRQLLNKTDYFFHWVCSLVSTNQIWFCSV